MSSVFHPFNNGIVFVSQGSTMVISNKPVLLACLLQLIVHTTGQFIDTCIPNYFQYMKDETTGEITSGRISVHKVPIGIPLQLGVALGMSAQLPMVSFHTVNIKYFFMANSFHARSVTSSSRCLGFRSKLNRI